MLEKFRTARRHRRAESDRRFAYRTLIARGYRHTIADAAASRYALAHGYGLPL